MGAAFVGDEADAAAEDVAGHCRLLKWDLTEDDFAVSAADAQMLLL